MANHCGEDASTSLRPAACNKGPAAGQDSSTLPIIRPCLRSRASLKGPLTKSAQHCSMEKAAFG